MHLCTRTVRLLILNLGRLPAESFDTDTMCALMRKEGVVKWNGYQGLPTMVGVLRKCVPYVSRMHMRTELVGLPLAIQPKVE